MSHPAGTFQGRESISFASSEKYLVKSIKGTQVFLCDIRNEGLSFVNDIIHRCEREKVLCDG
jgi:hypothetical protein